MSREECASGELCGGKVEVYLLKKCRLARHAAGERSFHSLYQLCAAPAAVRRKLLLGRAAGGEEDEAASLDGFAYLRPEGGEGGRSSRWRPRPWRRRARPEEGPGA